MKKRSLFWLLFGLLFSIAILLRLYKIDNSITEWFSWRQADTAAVGKFFISDGFNLLKPRYYDLSPIQSGKENFQGWRFVEFPLYNALFAALTRFIGQFPLEIWARLTTLFFSLLALYSLYYILFKEYGTVEAFFGGLFFAAAPYVVFYSRTILPDMPSVSLAVFSIFFSYLYSQKPKWYYWLLATLFFALALLVKPMVIFYFIIQAYLFLRSHGEIKTKIFRLAAFGFLSTLPFILWRFYIRNYPEGIPANQWLITSVNTSQGLQNIFFKPSFFRWIFFERINNLILGGYLSVFMLLGIQVVHGENKKTSLLSWLFLAAMLFYLFTFQGGNVQHDYYQTVITPALAVLIGVGTGWWFKQGAGRFGQTLKISLFLIIFAASFVFSYYLVKNNYQENKGLLSIAEVVKTFTNKKDIIITDTQGDTTLLYLAERRGFPAPYQDVKILKNKGAKYFVTTNFDYREEWRGVYNLVFENDKFLLFAL